jgi:hypothetical protein
MRLTGLQHLLEMADVPNVEAAQEISFSGDGVGPDQLRDFG